MIKKNKHPTFSKEPYYSFSEEILNSLSHGIGIGLSLVGVTLLLLYGFFEGNAKHLICFGVYGFSLVFLYTASTFYHLFQNKKLKKVFRILDHCGIYLLIAGTYTPFMLLAVGGVWGISLLLTIWILAFLGILFKFFYTGKHEFLSTILYLLMGWLAILALKPMLQSLPTQGIAWLFAGGGLYSSGVVFYIWESLPFNHAIWHLFVLLGSMCHFFAVYFSLIP